MSSLSRHLTIPFWLGLLATTAFFLLGTATAQPTAVVLLYYQGMGLDNAVLLEWGTATEFNTAGFRLERAPNANGPYVFLNEIGFIMAEGEGIIGAEYEATDYTAVNGTTYWYKLIEVEFDGSENPETPIAVTAGVQPTATATQTPTPSRTATATVTRTAPATVAATVAATSLPSPTNTTMSGNLPAATAPTAVVLATSTPQPGITLPASSAQSTPTAAVAPGKPPPANATAVSFLNPNPALAQGAATPTNATGYPGTGAAATTPSLTETAYPEPELTAEPADPEAYPVETAATPAFSIPGSTTNGQSPNIIGNNNHNDQATDMTGAGDNQAAQTGVAGNGRIFLWISFLAALLIFITAVLGCIILFTRQRSQGN
jgi:hypothetical protein